jgi:hypothetical protein
MVVGLRDFYPKSWILAAAPGIKLGVDKPACSRYFLADSLLGTAAMGNARLLFRV